MKSTKIEPKIQRSLQILLKEYPKVQDIIQEIDKKGGNILLIGGAVRDLLLGKETKDLDIEVHGLSADTLESILKKFGQVSFVGKAYGVYRLHGLDIDWSLPRSDKPGRKPKVIIDPEMSIKEAFSRRDLTINAMGIDLINFELQDPFNGYEDLKKGVLRAPDEQRFIEDPLRLFRVMQFISRFEFKPDEKLNKLCKEMSLKNVSVERIEQELQKLLLKSKRPSLGFRWLNQIGRLREIFPELAATIDVKQDEEWHPEGDVFEHTMQSIDAAANVTIKDSEEKLLLLYAALCHDLGKPSTTQKIEGKWRSLGHAQAAVPVAKQFLKRITRNKDLIEGVQKLVRYHMEPAQFIEGKAKQSAYKRLANKLAPHATLQLLADLARVDKQGRNPLGSKPLSENIHEIELFEQEAENAQVRKKMEQPILQGRDLITIVKPGPQMGVLLEKAYQIQLEEGIKDKKVLKERVLKNYKK